MWLYIPTICCSEIVHLFLEFVASLLCQLELFPGLVSLHHQSLLDGQCLGQLLPHAGCGGIGVFWVGRDQLQLQEGTDG